MGGLDNGTCACWRGRETGTEREKQGARAGSTVRDRVRAAPIDLDKDTKWVRGRGKAKAGARSELH